MSKENDPFFEHQRIPEKLEQLFENYKNNGDYMDLERGTICFIKHDKEEHKDNQDYQKKVIHNLSFAYNKQEVDNDVYQNLLTLRGPTIYVALITVAINVAIDSAKTLSSTWEHIVYWCIMASFVAIAVFAFKCNKWSAEDILKHRQWQEYLNFCIEEYKKE